MKNAERIVISKSAKRKMPSAQNPLKAGTYTEMVVYKTPIGKGRFKSVTKHEMKKQH